MNRPEFLRVAVAPEVGQVIVDSLPGESSGAHGLPSQQEFYEQAIPLIRETFSVYFDELKSLVPGRDDHKFAVFASYTNPDIPYMFHCHILDHEDVGMMGQFRVVED